MDNLTHSLFGAVLGQTGLKRPTGLAMPALIIGANLPDVDAACFFWLEGTEHLGFRRGITHGPPAMVLLPLILAGLLWGYDRWQARRGTRPEERLPVSFKWLYLLGLIGCLSHPALDWLNVYGIRFLEPFSSQWAYGDTLFIIDVWWWALLGFGLWFSLRRERAGKTWRWPAIATLAASLLYLGHNYLLSASTVLNWAINTKGPSVGVPIADPVRIASPVPLAFWEREFIVGAPNHWYRVAPGEVPSPRNARPITDQPCAWPSPAQLASGGSQAEAFLFWSRAPFAERATDGSVILRDARFYDPRARDRFAVPLPGVKCLPRAAG
ncbi:metal-dependent hydrolase [Novosphingobium sp.]|uniref:metal-dependent hydrolase n=1 Tax=Novosphingobium sp. TaxID=1874826 RepID=UPI0022BD7004|nr:metal-dependent hydrolase [Novosphingobium sp.]MCZ8019450.1 metal-dependent hydrolase [Novosphingobium sp.]MCZ8035265.1 metal-dependent hydrolase [Novosphingobium sp.]MCZ8050579.1 metal-dependent hydrolase [Novosphingobium sp.]MCZ8058925.1 metal-dependent hydrolase [Novosphingobium sp.]MCZ8232370.1 metal-dependent hydrolase [Novosphingobium sp.]